MKTALLMALVINSINAFAASDNIILIGGGGEPLGASTTQFDASMEGVGDFYQKNKEYQTTVNFNGGHSKTESTISKKFKGADIRNNFTAQSYDKLIEDTLRKMESGEIPSGGKVLLFIDSHGGQKRGETHNISTANSAMTDMNNGGASMVSLDKLKAISDLAEKKNIKLGIVDGSCHAGNSLALANSKTCVVAGSGPLHYSYSSFAAAFAKNMKKGKNLEEIFLESSKKVDGLGFPMISSPAGSAVQDEIYPYLTPYMYYHDEYRGMSLDKIDNYIKSVNTPELECRRNEDFDKLNNILKLVEQVSAIQESGKGGIDLGRLKKKIASYKKTQDGYFKKLSSLNMATLDRVESIVTPDGKYKSTYTHKELLTTDYSYLIESKKKSINPGMTQAKRDQALGLIEFYKICETTKARIIRENPQYTEQDKIMAKLKKDDDVGREIAFDIMKEANTAYNSYYKIKEKELESSQNRVPNACKDFVL